MIHSGLLRKTKFAVPSLPFTSSAVMVPGAPKATSCVILASFQVKTLCLTVNVQVFTPSIVLPTRSQMPVTVALSCWPSRSSGFATSGTMMMVLPSQTQSAVIELPSSTYSSVILLPSMDLQFMGSLKVMLMSSPSDSSPSAGWGVPKTWGAFRSIVPTTVLE